MLPLRLFRNPVFIIAAAIGLAAGFALFGALSYLPLFLQVVHGVSPTISGVYLLPMVLGLLITSIGSGQLIARTGRYKIFPIIGSALMAFALVFAVDAGRDHPDMADDLYFFLLGAGLGLIIQVLVIAVQNTVGYADLGAATSGVTFFRTIGGAFGVSIFGAIFSDQLASQLAPALPGEGCRPAFTRPVESDPSAIKQLPADLHHAIVNAFSLALHPAFLTAVPIAVIAFVLAWFLREVPLRAAAASRPAAIPPRAATSVKPSAALPPSVPRPGGGAGAVPAVRLDLRRFGYARLARSAGLDLPGGACWVLAKLARHGATPGPNWPRCGRHPGGRPSHGRAAGRPRPRDQEPMAYSR